MSTSFEIPGLMRFLDGSPTPFHAVAYLGNYLRESGFTELDESRSWSIEPGRSYFVTRASSSLFAFRMPLDLGKESALRLVGAHSDSPCLRIKPNPSLFKDGYHLLNIEVYGSPLLGTWFDRDLGFGGLLVYRRKGESTLRTKLMRSQETLRIPQLAIHLDREGSQAPRNPQTQMAPILGRGQGDTYFQHLLESHLEPNEDLVDFDLHLYDQAPAVLGGLGEEFLYSGRLDNLASCHAGIRALIETPAHAHNITGVFLFHNEEIGSVSFQGAQSTFASHSLERLLLTMPKAEQLALYPRSLMISADMAHAVHPSFEDKHDPSHKPHINQGVVLKVNANRRYATEAQTAAAFREICRIASVPLQVFSSRNDIGCGSTIGPAIAAGLGIPTVDVGCPMLSMHSIREMCGTTDQDYMIRALKGHFST